MYINSMCRWKKCPLGGSFVCFCLAFCGSGGGVGGRERRMKRGQGGEIAQVKRMGVPLKTTSTRLSIPFKEIGVKIGRFSRALFLTTLHIDQTRTVHTPKPGRHAPFLARPPLRPQQKPRFPILQHTLSVVLHSSLPPASIFCPIAP